MRIETIKLPPSIAGGHAPTLTAYLQDNVAAQAERARPAMLICPGGGYEFCSDRESEPVALAFAARGYQAFVLNYTVLGTATNEPLLPVPQRDLAHAVALIRKRAATWSVDPTHIATIGFSAGGHLCATYGALSRREDFAADLGLTCPDIAIEAQILCYPVIDLTAGWPSDPARIAPICDSSLVAAQKLVDAKTPRTFLWHTATDSGVPVRNSYAYAAALAEAGVDHELHVFHRGPHGMSLATRESSKDSRYEDARAATWLDLAIDWLEEGR